MIIQFNNLRKIGQLYYATSLYFFENQVPDWDKYSIIQAQELLKISLNIGLSNYWYKLLHPVTLKKSF